LLDRSISHVFSEKASAIIPYFVVGFATGAPPTAGKLLPAPEPRLSPRPGPTPELRRSLTNGGFFCSSKEFCDGCFNGDMGGLNDFA